jgi:hypothetical protein
MALLPVLKFLQPTGMAIDGGQDLHQRDEIALGEVVLQGLGIAFFQRGGADRKAHLLEFDVWVFPVEDVSVRGEILPVQRRIKVREHGSGAIPDKWMFVWQNDFLGSMPPRSPPRALERSLLFWSAV